MHAITTLLLVTSLLTHAAIAQAADEPAEQEAAPQPSTQAVVTRQMEFQLPFKVPKLDDKRSTPVEVRLFVSPDQGRTWQTHSRVRPENGHCPFAAKSDGHYWFMIRTVDRQGKLWPQTAAGPEMKVTVDTQPPKAQLTATWNPAGEVAASWNVVDATLEPTSPKLQYRALATEAWQTVAITPASKEHPQNQSGKATWWPRSSTGQITVRFEALDKAGNPAVVQRTLKAPSQAASQALAKQHAARPPITNNFAVAKPATTLVTQPQPQPQATTPQPAANVAAQAQPPVANPPANRTQTPPAQATRAQTTRAQVNRAVPACHIKLTSTALQQDRLTLRWQTSGTSILRRTVHLAYSNTAQGPWVPVALNQQDDGHHVWQFQANTPEQAFLLIEVVDRAGARSRYITPKPLRLRPQVSGIQHTGQAPAEYRFF
jgi:hypothetical protein